MHSAESQGSNGKVLPAVQQMNNLANVLCILERRCCGLTDGYAFHPINITVYVLNTRPAGFQVSKRCVMFYEHQCFSAILPTIPAFYMDSVQTRSWHCLLTVEGLDEPLRHLLSIAGEESNVSGTKMGPRCP